MHIFLFKFLLVFANLCNLSYTRGEKLFFLNLLVELSMFEQGTIKDHGHLKPSEIGWDDYFMDICRVIGEKGTCDRGRSGCVIVRDNMILATGFVTAPKGSSTCDEVGHQMWQVLREHGGKSDHCMRNNCAEHEAIANAGRQGDSLE
jgi:dCMP deaminase